MLMTNKQFNPLYPFQVVRYFSYDEPPKVYFRVLIHVGCQQEGYSHPLEARKDYWIPYEDICFELKETAVKYVENLLKERGYGREERMRSSQLSQHEAVCCEN